MAASGGTPHPWEFARVWHLEPSLTEVDTLYAGVEDAALFRSTDRSRLALGGHPRSESRGRPLRAPYRLASGATRRALHAEALGHHAQRRWRRFVAGSERQSPNGLRLSDRHPRSRSSSSARWRAASVVVQGFVAASCDERARKLPSSFHAFCSDSSFLHRASPDFS